MAATAVAQPPTCPACSKVMTPSNETARAFDGVGPLMHRECAAHLAETLREMDAARSAYVPFTPADFPDFPGAAARELPGRVLPHDETLERVFEVRAGDGTGDVAEYIDATRYPNGAVSLVHSVAGVGRDCIVMDKDDAARLAAFLLRTLRPAHRRIS